MVSLRFLLHEQGFRGLALFDFLGFHFIPSLIFIEEPVMEDYAFKTFLLIVLTGVVLMVIMGSIYNYHRVSYHRQRQIE